MNLVTNLIILTVLIILCNGYSAIETECPTIGVSQVSDYNGEETLFLLQETQNVTHRNLNSEFCKSTKGILGRFKVRILEGNGFEMLEKTIEASKYKYIINLRVTDFYNFNHKYKEQRNLLYFRDNDEIIQTTQVCGIKNQLNRSTKIEEVMSNSVVLISEGVIENETLNYALNYPITVGDHYETKNNQPSNKAILICNGVNVPKMNLYGIDIIEHGDNCYETAKTLEQKLLIVIANNYFDNVDSISVPVVLRQAPYLLPEYKDIYPKEMVVNYLLERTVMNFIIEMDWQRIAMVSDNSLYSVDFENKLIPLFIDNNKVYAIERCEDTQCIEKAIQKLLEAQAKVIILNVDEGNMKSIEVTVTGIVWLVRNLPFSDIRPKLNGHVYALSSAPIRIEDILNIVKTLRPWSATSSTIFEQNFKEDIMRLMNKTQKTKIFTENRIAYENNIGFQYRPTLPDSPSCPFGRSNDFYTICDDYTILLFLLVLTVFLVLVFVIYLYFSEMSQQTNNSL